MVKLFLTEAGIPCKLESTTKYDLNTYKQADSDNNDLKRDSKIVKNQKVEDIDIYYHENIDE